MNSDVKTGRKDVMLYLSPQKYSKEEFEQYVEFMLTEWPKMKEKITLNQGYRIVNIAGLVYGEDSHFEMIFNGKGDYSITVKTNGQILYGNKTSTESTNLSERVMMPGKKIYIKKQGGNLNPETLRRFNDKAAKSLYDYFNILEIEE